MALHRVFTRTSYVYVGSSRYLVLRVVWYGMEGRRAVQSSSPVPCRAGPVREYAHQYTAAQCGMAKMGIALLMVATTDAALMSQKVQRKRQKHHGWS